MWLYAPSNCAPEWACLEKDCEPGSDTWASRLEASATLSGKLTQPQSWRRALKKEAWTQLLSGVTCSPSTLELGAAQWIASLQASPAKTSALQAAVLGSTARAPGSSSACSTSPTIAVRGSSFWRTSAASLLPPPPLWTKPKGLSTSARPPASWENWPTEGGTRNGSLFPRPMWAPATAAPAGSASPGAWPTPQVGTGDNSHGQISGDFRNRMEELLKQPQWSSPRASDGKNGGPNQRGSKGDLMLPSMAAQWPTPASRDYRSPNAHSYEARGGGMKGEQLNNYVAHHFSLPQDQPIRDGRESSLITPRSPRHLNPIFGAWLMGWPSAWVIAEPHASSALATVLWRSRLQQELSRLCGEQETERKAA